MPNFSIFPGATHTFTVLRKQSSHVGANQVPASPVVVISNIAIWIKEKTGYIDIGTGNSQTFIQYIGNCDINVPIQIGDVISDETENDKNGNPVKYEVQSKTINLIAMKMNLTRYEIGN